MGTQTMYERIMSLPLFKGVGKEHVSSFLEKTSLTFKNFCSGDLIVGIGDDIRTLRFLLSGSVGVMTPVFADGVSVDFSLKNDVVIGADRLFGINTRSESEIYALESVSVMEFSKEKYMALLRSDPIYLINFANSLSMKSQTVADKLRNVTENSLEGIFTRMLVIYSTRNSENVSINGLSVISGIYPFIDVDRELIRLEREGLGKRDGDSFLIADRNAFIDSAI